MPWRDENAGATHASSRNFGIKSDGLRDFTNRVADGVGVDAQLGPPRSCSCLTSRSSYVNLQRLKSSTVKIVGYSRWKTKNGNKK